MTYTVLESHAYDIELVIKYFCTTTNFSCTYVHTYSDFSNPGLRVPPQGLIPGSHHRVLGPTSHTMVSFPFFRYALLIVSRMHKFQDKTISEVYNDLPLCFNILYENNLKPLSRLTIIICLVFFDKIIILFPRRRPWLL